MGANGLRDKIHRFIDNKKVGYEEIFSRYGSRYQRVTPGSDKETEEFMRLISALIAKANAGAGVNIQRLIAQCDNSPRRIYDELMKANR